MTKKLLAILISVVLVVSCMMVPVMAADATELAENGTTYIEMEHFFTGESNPVPDSETGEVSLPSRWFAHDNAHNGYLYYNDWLSGPGTVRTYELSVISTCAGYYNLEYVANGPACGYSDIAFYVNGTLVDSVKTNNENTKLTDFIFKDCDMRLYTKPNVELAEGINIIEIVISNGSVRNAFAMDYIGLTPASKVNELKVVSIEDETTQFSIMFNKPVLDTPDNLALITVNATSKDNSKQTIKVNEQDRRKVIVTHNSGKITINVDGDFSAANDNQKLVEDKEFSFFLKPATPKSGSSNKISKGKCSQENRMVYAYIGVDRTVPVKMYTRFLLALYDGDKMVACNSKQGENTYGGSVSVVYPEGVKFTEAKLFTWYTTNKDNISQNEYIPICQPDVRTAADLGFTFE